MFAQSSDYSVNQSWIEHQALEHIKRALRVTLEWRVPTISYTRKRSSVSFAMECFARHMERLMTIEEEGGYLHAVAEAKPHNLKRVTALHGDHARFRQELAQLSEELQQLDDWHDDVFDNLCAAIDHLLDEIDKHDQAEVRLLQEAMLQDEGVGD